MENEEVRELITEAQSYKDFYMSPEDVGDLLDRLADALEATLTPLPNGEGLATCEHGETGPHRFYAGMGAYHNCKLWRGHEGFGS